jgi:hypothetical protein
MHGGSWRLELSKQGRTLYRISRVGWYLDAAVVPSNVLLARNIH